MTKMSESVGSRIASVKERVFARSDYLCECCGQWACTVYVPDDRPHRLACDNPGSAVAVCSRCFDYIEEDPVTGQARADVTERQAALAIIYGQGEDSLVFRLLAGIEDYKQELVPVLVW